MSEFDGHAYERKQGERQRQIIATLLDMPEFRKAIDHYGRGPVVILHCPRGHKLIPITADVNDSRVTLSPLPGNKARKSGAVTTYGEPWRHLSRGICQKPGCPVRINHHGYCIDHGGRLEEIGGIRTVFTCRSPKCTWSGPVTTARLLQLYGLAVRLGRHDIPLSDTPG